MTTPWTEEERQVLINNYPFMTTKQLMERLNKTSGQIRGMKTKLGLKGKFNPFTENEKSLIRAYYLDNPDDIDLNYLSQKMNRPKTSISRFARKEGLTINNRPLSDKSLEKMKSTKKIFYESDKYKTEVYPKQCEQLRYYSKNKHPRGMLGKHHTKEVCERISQFQLNRSSSMTYDEKHEIAMKAVKTKRKNGTLNNTTSNAYSRTKGGKRIDLNNQYFRSAWEANVARILNHLGIQWKYEYKRFIFHENDTGIDSYQPDFYLPELDKWIEVKGWMDKKSIIRLKLFENDFPNEYEKLILIDENFYNLLRYTYFNLENWEDKAKQTKPYRNNYFKLLNESQRRYIENIFLIKNTSDNKNDFIEEDKKEK